MSGINIKITDSGGKSYPDIASAIRSGADDVKEEIYADVERAVRRLTCPVHNETASIKRTQSGFEIEACCEQFSDQAQAAVDRALQG